MQSAARVAVVGDVHGNAVALAAVLEEVRSEAVDLVVSTGDLTWGWEPAQTLALVGALHVPARYVRGNAERALFELAEGRAATTERERWMLAQHNPADLAFVTSFQHSISVDVAGLGPTLFAHGSPRSDEELLTAETPPEWVAEATAGISERVLVTGHTHHQFDRALPGVRSINPGSVGMPYEGRAGAYWALLGPDVELRRTEYDLDEALARIRASGDPLAEQMIEILTSPPTREEVIEQGRRVRFAG